MNEFEIIDLYLEGFAKIYTGMHIDRVYLNFSEMPNPIYLFVGDSGSGKTSILKSIHPFAFNSGTGDESGNSKLIMSKRDGKKIIRYRVRGKLIVCTHYYIRKPDDTIQVKSYLSVDGEEMNPSGLVTTFKDLVKDYFFIDESFLALLALGNSVRSMVDYTSGERKKFAVRIFTELNIYMTYYKTASANVRTLDNILGNVIDKLGRYGNYDKQALKGDISDVKKSIRSTETVLSGVLQEQGAIKSNLERDKEAYQQYSECHESITSLLAEIEKLKTKRKTSSDSAVLENQKNDAMRDVIGTELRIESLEASIKSELEFKEVKLNMKANLEDSITRMEGNTDRVELEKLLANIDSELTGLDDIEVVDGVDYVKKKEDLITASIYLDELRGMCTDLITEVQHQDLIQGVFENFIKNERCEYDVDLAYRAVVERITNLENANHLAGSIKLPKISSSCKEKSCPYRKFYEDSMEILTSKQESADRILRMERAALDVAETKKTIIFVLKKLYKYIKKHADHLNGLPTDIFNPKEFVLTFINTTDRVVYNTDLMSSSISYLEQAVRKSQLLTLQDSTKKQLSGIETTISLYDSMKVDLEKTIRAIEKTDETLTWYQNDLDYNREKLKEHNDTVKELESEIELALQLEDYRKRIGEAQKQLKNMDDCRERYEKFSKELTLVEEREAELQTQLSEHRRHLNQLEEMLRSVTELESEKEILSTKYSNAVIIRDAVSPAKGVPVEFIENVIRNQVIDSINELMHIAYPDITLLKGKDELIIDEKEFTIPYKKSGVIISDISEASDGERAMMSLAFSLVLIRLVSKVYNVMLLDEMDAKLDKYGRSKYIDIIEQYMKTINAKQVFMISHNSMFDMYCVNALQTTKDASVSTDKFVINVYEQNYTPTYDEGVS